MKMQNLVIGGVCLGAVFWLLRNRGKNPLGGIFGGGGGGDAESGDAWQKLIGTPGDSAVNQSMDYSPAGDSAVNQSMDYSPAVELGLWAQSTPFSTVVNQFVNIPQDVRLSYYPEFIYAGWANLQDANTILTRGDDVLRQSQWEFMQHVGM